MISSYFKPFYTPPPPCNHVIFWYPHPRPLQTFAAYNINSCIQGSLGKLQGQARVTHFWKIRMEEDPIGGLCNFFSVYLGYFKQGKNYKLI